MSSQMTSRQSEWFLALRAFPAECRLSYTWFSKFKAERATLLALVRK